ncbi:MAG: cysteine hydrolase [Alphaproteobacteria bacterium]|nr:cysteine hydrolase [Alphaproteobacteria bacterium]
MTAVETAPRTLLAMAGATPAPPPLSEAALVLIDYQREYTTGGLSLSGVDQAVNEGAALLKRARAAGAPVIHIAHKGKPDGLFDRQGEGGAIIEEMAPVAGEIVVEKGLPNAFAGTALAETLAGVGGRAPIIIGFMTHMCVSATVRSAVDNGHMPTVVAAACATRDLPSPAGGVMPAETLHDATLAALADRFAWVVASATDISD